MEFIYRATRSDGTVHETSVKACAEVQRSFAPLAQKLERERTGDDGLTVVRMIRENADTPWREA